MSSPRVLIVGSGGREHALAWRLSRDPVPCEVVCAPGNEGLARHVRCVPVAPDDAAGLASRTRSDGIDLVVIGPEVPLAAGLADRLRAEGIDVFGPGAAAARVESSKWFAKQLMLERGIPTAAAECVTDRGGARRALDRFPAPYVVKVDGLAAGKGVCVTHERAEAERFADAALEGRFGDAGRRLVIEEGLEGEEVSVMAITDGTQLALLPAARDYKRAYDHDRGPNTGGMGAFAPSDRLGAGGETEAAERVFRPLLAALRERDLPFRGALYAGLMVGPAGLRVLEFNARFGDPEAQVVLPLVNGSLFAALRGAARGALDPGTIGRDAGAAVTVALVDRDYPEGASGNGVVEGLEAIERDPDLALFQAGLAWDGGAARVKGGRVAYVTARARDREDARARVYRAIDRLGGTGWRCRRDIAALGAAAGRELTTGRH